MKTLIFTAAAAAFTMLVAAPVPALVQADVEKPAATKCVWFQGPGPRATPRRVCEKVGDQREQMNGMGGPECDPAYRGKTGRWEWRSRPQYGPRAPLQPPVQVWVEAC